MDEDISQICFGFERFIDSGELTVEEVIVIKWQYGYFGSFYTALIDCFRRADRRNKAKLATAFPIIEAAMGRHDMEEGFAAQCEEKAERLNINKR